MSTDNVTLVTSAIMMSIMGEQSPMPDPRLTQECNLLLTKVAETYKGSMSDFHFEKPDDQTEPEKWLQAWGNQVASLVSESGLAENSTLVALAKSVLSAWEAFTTPPPVEDIGDYMASSGGLAGDSTTDAPPPKK